MNGQKVLAIEFGIAVAVAGWAAIKHKFWPWPPTIVKTAIAFSLLGVVSVASEELAAALGAGFILANLVRMYQGNQPFVGGVPTQNTPEFPYPILMFGGGAKPTSLTPQAPMQGPPSAPNTPAPPPTQGGKSGGEFPLRGL